MHSNIPRGPSVVCKIAYTAHSICVKIRYIINAFCVLALIPKNWFWFHDSDSTALSKLLVIVADWYQKLILGQLTIVCIKNSMSLWGQLSYEQSNSSIEFFDCPMINCSGNWPDLWAWIWTTISWWISVLQ